MALGSETKYYILFPEHFPKSPAGTIDKLSFFYGKGNLHIRGQKDSLCEYSLKWAADHLPIFQYHRGTVGIFLTLCLKNPVLSTFLSNSPITLDFFLFLRHTKLAPTSQPFCFSSARNVLASALCKAISIPPSRSQYKWYQTRKVFLTLLYREVSHAHPTHGLFYFLHSISLYLESFVYFLSFTSTIIVIKEFHIMGHLGHVWGLFPSFQKDGRDTTGSLGAEIK